MEVRCSIADTGAEAAYLEYRDAVCAGKSRRYAMLCKGADGIRCKLQNSGRCLDPDTPWHMVKGVIEPMFRFDEGTEWVAIFTVEQWKTQLDAAVASSIESGRPWMDELSESLAAGLESRPRLVVTR